MSDLSSLSKPLKDERRGHKKSPHELARQSEAKLKQARQSEANRDFKQLTATAGWTPAKRATTRVKVDVFWREKQN